MYRFYWKLDLKSLKKGGQLVENLKDWVLGNIRGVTIVRCGYDIELCSKMLFLLDTDIKVFNGAAD